jgi:hypothetical protein
MCQYFYHTWKVCKHDEPHLSHKTYCATAQWKREQGFTGFLSELCDKREYISVESEGNCPTCAKRLAQNQQIKGVVIDLTGDDDEPVSKPIKMKASEARAYNTKRAEELLNKHAERKRKRDESGETSQSNKNKVILQEVPATSSTQRRILPLPKPAEYRALTIGASVLDAPNHASASLPGLGAFQAPRPETPPFTDTSFGDSSEIDPAYGRERRFSPQWDPKRQHSVLGGFVIDTGNQSPINPSRLGVKPLSFAEARAKRAAELARAGGGAGLLGWGHRSGFGGTASRSHNSEVREACEQLVGPPSTQSYPAPPGRSVFDFYVPVEPQVISDDEEDQARPAAGQSVLATHEPVEPQQERNDNEVHSLATVTGDYVARAHGFDPARLLIEWPIASAAERAATFASTAAAAEQLLADSPIVDVAHHGSPSADSQQLSVEPRSAGIPELQLPSPALQEPLIESPSTGISELRLPSPAARPFGEYPAVRPAQHAPAPSPAQAFLRPLGEYLVVRPAQNAPAPSPAQEFVHPFGEYPVTTRAANVPAPSPAYEFGFLPAPRPLPIDFPSRDTAELPIPVSSSPGPQGGSLAAPRSAILEKVLNPSPVSQGGPPAAPRLSVGEILLGKSPNSSRLQTS